MQHFWATAYLGFCVLVSIAAQDSSVRFYATNFARSFEIRRIWWFMFRATKKDITAERTVFKIFTSQTLSLMGLMGQNARHSPLLKIAPWGSNPFKIARILRTNAQISPGRGPNQNLQRDSQSRILFSNHSCSESNTPDRGKWVMTGPPPIYTCWSVFRPELRIYTFVLDRRIYPRWFGSGRTGITASALGDDLWCWTNPFQNCRVVLNCWCAQSSRHSSL